MMEQNEMPQGFRFALAQNPAAVAAFANLSEAGQAELVAKARAAASKEEMQSLVRGLTARQ